MSIQIANAAGFWGDDPSAPQRLVRAARVNYLTLEYLAELTMSILAHLKSKDPRAGFATDILHVIDDLAPSLVEQPQLRIITNAGGINPEACAVAVARRLVDAELGDEGIAVVSGDDLTSRLAELQAAGCHLAHLDTGQPLADVPRRVACANAYLGAEPMVESLHRGARIVLTGRVADASLTVAPAVFEFGWEPRDWRRLAGATVAGHLIECGAQVTGGYSDRWDSLDLLDIGYPIAELGPEGDSVITKPAGSGGIVDRRSVVEQLVYEIGDPAVYITPDVVADFTSVHVVEEGLDRVRITGAQGGPPPDTYKVSLAYFDGYLASAQLLVRGRRAEAKARYTGELVRRRLSQCGSSPEHFYVECLGAGDGVPAESGPPGPGGFSLTNHLPRLDLNEVVLRICARDSRRAVVERFTREIAPLITNGPSGLAGYASGRAVVRPVIAYWPTAVPRDLVPARVAVRTAREWLDKEWIRCPG